MQRTTTAFAILVLLAALGACDGPDVETPSSGLVIDTLPNGAVRVSNSAEGAWSREGREPWRLEELFRVGELEGEGPYMFTSVRDVLPGTHDRTWVLESTAYELRLFGPDGRFEKAVGGEGEGPGEFTGNTCAFSGPDGEIWVESRGRWQRFDEEGMLIGALQSTSNFSCAWRLWTADDRFLVVGIDYTVAERENQRYFTAYRFRDDTLTEIERYWPPRLPEGRTLTLQRIDGRTRITSSLPFEHRPRWTLGLNGDFWISEGDRSYRLRGQTPTGDTLRIIERAYEPIPIPAHVRDQAIRELDREGYKMDPDFDPDQVVTTYPPFEWISFAPDGTLWIRRQVDEDTVGFDVFEESGIYLGAVALPPNLQELAIRHIGIEVMHGVVTDALDVPTVVKLAIRKPGRP